MADFINESSNMDNLPTPPRFEIQERNEIRTTTTNTTITTPQSYIDRGSPHSIDLETAGSSNSKLVTPNKEVRSPVLRSSSPRPISNSPSEYLLKTTAARVNDGQVLERRRSSLIIPDPKPVIAKGKVQPPSEHLMKTTQARLSDVKEWQSRRGVIKHDDDIWWEQRKPLENASKANLKVESRLYAPTTSHVYSQRKKFPARTTPDKHAVPGSTEKSPSKLGQAPLVVTKINAESPLLRSTFNSVVKNVKNSPVPPPPPALELFSHSSGPQNVASKLFAPTTSTRCAKWKSREEIAQEETYVLLADKPAKKVKSPSHHLVTYNESMRNSARQKAEKVEGDQREVGWSNGYKKLQIPGVEAVPLLPNQRPGSSPYRRRSEGGGHSRGDSHRSLNSSLESTDEMHHDHEQEQHGDEDLDQDQDQQQGAFTPERQLQQQAQGGDDEEKNNNHNNTQADEAQLPMDQVLSQEGEEGVAGGAENFESY